MVGLKMELLEIHTTDLHHVKNVIVKENKKRIGFFIRDIDGFFYFYEDGNDKGGWDSNVLREIANKLDKANDLWNNEVEKQFNKVWDVE